MSTSLALARRQSRWLLPLLAIAAAAALLIAVVGAITPADAGVGQPGPPSGNGVTPVVHPDNPTCSDLVPGTTELRVEPVTSGEHTDGTLTVTLTVDDAFFDWTSNIGINAVFVKGGDNGNLYVYDPPATSDTDLHAPINPANDKPFGLSHVSFCYGLAPPPPPPGPPGGEAAGAEQAGAPQAVTAPARFTG
jgi:hypothetical protein